MVVLQKSVSHFSLSKYPLGGFKELFSLSLPVSIVLLSGALMGFCDRLFLSYDSLENLEGCVDAAFLCYLFQISLIFGARTTQIFVGECFGSNRFHDVGSYVWQMIWLSLFSMVFTLPLGRVAELLFFRGTVVEEAGTTYFRCLMSFNFLFPLATALSSFYIGRGKINIIFWSTLISNIVNLILDPIFIFGLPGFFPRMGIFGSALATGISQGILCFMLFRHFLSQQNRNEFGTGAYRLNKKVLWESIRIGFPKLVSKAVVVTIWVANVHVMTLKGGDHLLVLSIGSTFGLLFLFLNEGLCQGVLTIASYALGKKDNEAISRLLRSGLLFLLASTVIVAIPCLFFPKWFIACFFSKVITYTQMNLMTNTLQCFWFFFICQGLTGTYMLLAAKKDTLFTMCYNLLFTWLFQYIPLFFAMHRWNWTGDKFYLILGCGNLASATIYFIRFMKLWKPTLSRILQDES